MTSNLFRLLRGKINRIKHYVNSYNLTKDWPPFKYTYLEEGSGTYLKKHNRQLNKFYKKGGKA